MIRNSHPPPRARIITTARNETIQPQRNQQRSSLGIGPWRYGRNWSFLSPRSWQALSGRLRIDVGHDQPAGSVWRAGMAAWRGRAPYGDPRRTRGGRGEMELGIWTDATRRFRREAWLVRSLADQARQA